MLPFFQVDPVFHNPHECLVLLTALNRRVYCALPRHRPNGPSPSETPSKEQPKAMQPAMLDEVWAFSI